jgi:flagellar hook-associated protein 3 FlgL
MFRVSTNMAADNLSAITGRTMQKMVEKQNTAATGVKHRVPRQGPVEVSQSIAYKRVIHELGQYERNIENGRSRIDVAETALGSATELLQRVRELGVQGANGVYSAEDRAAMAGEIDQLLRELVAVANTTYKGRAVFAGNDTLENPFRIEESFSPEAGKQVIQAVRYYGDMGLQNREIARGDVLAVNVPGNQAFWAESSTLFSSVDAAGYVLPVDSRVRINGQVVKFKAGDNVEMIVNRINNAPVPVRASVNRMNGGIILETSSARDIWIQDIQGGTLMQDLGVISGANPPRNLDPTARFFGGTVFDMVIRLRDSLYADDSRDVGSLGIGGVDQALDNIIKNRSDLGARASRMDLVLGRVREQRANMQDILSKNEDVDLAETITELRVLEAAHRAALGVTARIIQPTLLDFLR